jgi:hypothetical protein
MPRDRQTSLRLEGGLLARLQEAARENRRTLGAEISLRLERSFEDDNPTTVLQEIGAAAKVLAALGSKLAVGIPMNEGPNPYANATRRGTQKEKVKP